MADADFDFGAKVFEFMLAMIDRENNERQGQGKSKNKGKDETCGNWNQRVGACAADGPCRYGRIHQCSRCGGDHRLLDCKTAAGG